MAASANRPDHSPRATRSARATRAWRFPAHVALAVAVAGCATESDSKGNLGARPPGSDGPAADAAPHDPDGGPQHTDGGPTGDDAGLSEPCRSVGAWSSSEPFADGGHVSHPLPSFAAAGRFFVHTKTRDGNGDRILRAAKPRADGTLEPWTVSTADHGGGPHGFTAVSIGDTAYHFRNGHIARYAFDGSGALVGGDVSLVEQSVDTAFGGEKYVWDSAVHAPPGGGKLIHLGGFSFTPYAYRPTVRSTSAPAGPMFSPVGRDHPAPRPGKSTFVARAAGGGYLYTGESSEGDTVGGALWVSVVGADGSVGAFRKLANLPDGTGNRRGDLFSSGSTLFAVRGASVFAADVKEGGDLSVWKSMPSLPEAQIDISWGQGHLEGAAWGILGRFVYLAGPKVVFHAALSGRACE